MSISKYARRSQKTERPKLNSTERFIRAACANSPELAAMAIIDTLVLPSDLPRLARWLDENAPPPHMFRERVMWPRVARAVRAQLGL